MHLGLPHSGKVLDFFTVLESPWKYQGGFLCFTGTEKWSYFL